MVQGNGLLNLRLIKSSYGRLAAVALFGVMACEANDPVPSSTTGGGPNGLGCDADSNVAQVDGEQCAPLADDYTPREDGSANDTWPECISDDNLYHAFDPSVGTNARIGAFEQISLLLGFGGRLVPDAQDFIDARVLYTVDEGLESRISRREDEHYPKAPMACRDLTPDQQLQYADRCVGPAQIQPLLNQAFQEGAEGIDPVKNAARIEAALLWMFYVSSHKEAITCTEVQKDCDSSTGYYAGGQERDDLAGLARYIKSRSVQAHDRIWDGLLAVRCWRDLDNPTGIAADIALRDRAVAQLDRGLLRGVALIVRQRAQRLACEPAWETVRILGNVLLREAMERDPAQGAVLRAEIEKDDPAAVDTTAVVAALDAIFACP